MRDGRGERGFWLHGGVFGWSGRSGWLCVLREMLSCGSTNRWRFGGFC